ncbi:uncharacterized protein LOC126836166 [Adelges cooleyi]|uniref:uncharacterized protein LOC126836166 n=1 Tax=Adelges cooleyi TaxID=133065 RepID=UPI0021801844|nr:uncharacterized protein LOC126836166 [Adelges cooleyi]
MHDPISSRSTTLLCTCIVLCFHHGILCGTVAPPDANYTPPLEFPSEGRIKIYQASDTTNNLSETPIIYFGTPGSQTNGPTRKDQEANTRQVTGNFPARAAQQINLFSISKNYTENTINNNVVDNSTSSVWFILIGFLSTAVIFLMCYTYYVKQQKKFKLPNRELLVEECEEAIMNDLIHQVQHE